MFMKVDSRTEIQNWSSMETLNLVNLSSSTKDMVFLMELSLRSSIQFIKISTLTMFGIGLASVQTTSSVHEENFLG